jgi:hypothetical protein
MSSCYDIIGESGFQFLRRWPARYSGSEAEDLKAPVIEGKFIQISVLDEDEEDRLWQEAACPANNREP